MKFVFIRSNTLACQLIRAVDGGRWSHCAIGAQGDAGPFAGSAIEAGFPHGVRVRSWAGLLRDRPDHVVIEAPLPDEEAAMYFALGKDGAAYDWPAIPALAIRRVFGTAPLWERPQAWYCAELLLGACAAGGAPIEGPLRRHGVAAAFAHVQTLALKARQ